jgi:hypothetical protein
MLVLISCGYNSKGKILKRGECSTGENSLPWIAGVGSQEQYLVNDSRNEIITFTLKETQTMRWMNNQFEKTYTTDTHIFTTTYTLNPGEEKKLTCDRFIQKGQDSWEKHDYEIVGEVVKK